MPQPSSVPGISARSRRSGRMSTRLLFIVCWLSAIIFSAYIVVYYEGALLTHTMQDWNEVLPRIYQPGSMLATAAIGAHFLAGAIVLILGPMQLIAPLRARAPNVHRWIGRFYAAAALATGVGGLVYIAIEGTVGGPVMSTGFALYGALMVLCAVNTVRHARAGRFDIHRAWAIRLFALGIGSWLFRMDYGIWLKLIGGFGHHSHTYDGLFDKIMSFFFYVPNLAIAELIIRRRGGTQTESARTIRSASIGFIAVLVLVATILFGRSYWLPHITQRLADLSQMHTQRD
ncbi:DUF2306 domain-containing protein [Paraburkholderia edwinii]|uniref:DUF2306 domain-containing protein n=1 Tax=Paraburkholderia edwinii TaxID=2861782 RepID=A0ABX8V0L1_9BURK|nr:DUF2306 domain-containing protein [Paraburkholderia edwinii]QYD72640.1 DUF2306 domain-containing protein [Paraburkholderia edwinii]